MRGGLITLQFRMPSGVPELITHNHRIGLQVWLPEQEGANRGQTRGTVFTGRKFNTKHRGQCKLSGKCFFFFKSRCAHVVLHS
jgi:hypothetical protein